MNKVILMGRLTRNPELKQLASGTLVANFTLAVSRRFKSEGQPEADFIPIVAWGKTAEFVNNYFKKGQQVAVTGRIQVRNWEDKEGKTRYLTEVVADEVYFADSKKDNNSKDNNSNESQSEKNNEILDDDELPF